MSKALRIAVGSDHGGFELKTHIVSHLTALGHSVEDCGPHSKDAVDYPRFAAAVALRPDNRAELKVETA